MDGFFWVTSLYVLAQALMGFAINTLFLTIFGALILKYFVRSVPLLGHAVLFFWALFRVTLVAIVLTSIVALTRMDIPSSLSLSVLFIIAGMCAVGWLITYDLGRRYGVPTEFPGPGFKTMLCLLALTWAFISIPWLLFGPPGT
jgi:hypothetical protein